MTIKELKQKFEKYPDDTEVFINIWEDNEVDYYSIKFIEYFTKGLLDTSSVHLGVIEED